MAVKDQLRQVIAQARERESLELLPGVQDAAPDFGWTIKDTVAHLSVWREHAMAILEAARTGAAAPAASDDVDAENARIYAEIKDLPAAEVRRRAAESWDRLSSTIEGCSEAVLRSPRPSRPQDETWEVVPPNAHAHLAEHLGYLAQERGDVRAAEAAARWGHDLEVGAFTDAKSRADADYDLGCFYARQGRASEAFGWLRQALEVRPQLKQWAQQDRDLDPVRNDPQIASLLS